jgi:hypothetical protein
MAIGHLSNMTGTVCADADHVESALCKWHLVDRKWVVGRKLSVTYNQVRKDAVESCSISDEVPVFA